MWKNQNCWLLTTKKGERIMDNKMRNLNSKGFTLVELLVAATIAILCITSVTAMLIKGREIDVGDRYRRYARALVVSEFEKPQYHYSQYVNLLNQVGATTQNVTIDTRGAYDDIQGTMSTTISAQALAAGSGGTNVQHIPIVVSINWTTADGSDTLTLTKFISPIGN